MLTCIIQKLAKVIKRFFCIDFFEVLFLVTSLQRMQGSTMPMVSASENLVINQFPQPTRPLNAYDTSFGTPSTVYPQHENNTFGHPQHMVTPTMLKEEKGDKKFVLVDKLGNRVLDKIYEKLPAKLRDEINLEEVMGKERKRGGKSESGNSRGVGPGEIGLSDKEKLARFKIRTVVAEEVVVKEDEKK